MIRSSQLKPMLNYQVLLAVAIKGLKREAAGIDLSAFLKDFCDLPVAVHVPRKSFIA